MSATVHLFNPENDLALAANLANYTPPLAAVRLARAGSTLPLWYGSPGDMAICYGVPASWIDSMREKFGIGVGLFPHTTEGKILRPSPWGWSLYARGIFIDEGFQSDSLPTDDVLVKLRELSHRRTALAISADLASAGVAGMPLPGEEIADADVLSKILGGERELVLKMPWSSSGRGVVDTRLIGKDRALKFGADSIRRQGSVIIETAYDRVLDFAKLYECRDGKCQSLGTSVFLTDSRGSYVGNLLANEEERRKRVGEKTDLSILDYVAEALRLSIERRIAPYYEGVLGVDMLACRDGRLVPCVEINLRRTMGHVANAIADRYVGFGREGIFKVVPVKAGASTAEPVPVIEDGRLLRGLLNLVPDNPYFSIFAQIGDEGVEA